MVGMQGFEPWTSRSRSVRATKLRYIPTLFCFSCCPLSRGNEEYLTTDDNK